MRKRIIENSKLTFPTTRHTSDINLSAYKLAILLITVPELSTLQELELFSSLLILSLPSTLSSLFSRSGTFWIFSSSIEGSILFCANRGHQWNILSFTLTCQGHKIFSIIFVMTLTWLKPDYPPQMRCCYLLRIRLFFSTNICLYTFISKYYKEWLRIFSWSVYINI